MEHKIYEVITYNHNGKTIHLKVIPSKDHDCTNCFFYSNVNCANIENIVGRCIDIRRSDKTSVIFKEINNDKTMNENIDLTKILKNCPSNVVFHSSIYGDVTVHSIDATKEYPIELYKVIEGHNIFVCRLSKEGRINKQFGECTLFPSKEQRDWSKFTASWYNNENLIQNKFDPKNLIPFDKVLVRDSRLVSDSLSSYWRCQIFSFIEEEDKDYPYVCIGESYSFCIPYNDETKHLVGTNKEEPEYYRYWED